MKITTIKYSTLERDWPLLHVHRVNSARLKLSFEKVSGLPEEAESTLFNIDRIVSRAYRSMVDNVAGMFLQDYFDHLMEHIITRATFFQDKESFVKKHHEEHKDSVGIYYNEPRIKFGIKAGSYIMVESPHDPELTLLH